MKEVLEHAVLKISKTIIQLIGLLEAQLDIVFIAVEMKHKHLLFLSDQTGNIFQKSNIDPQIKPRGPLHKINEEDGTYLSKEILG